METLSRLRYFIYLSILIVGCTTGKNALQKGKYDASVSKAVDRLKNAPKNAEAMEVLKAAYELSLQSHLRKVDEARLSADAFKWETMLASFEQLNQLSEEINACPACLVGVPNPQRFAKEIEDSRFKAAEARYQYASTLLRENNRASAKMAYYNFEKAQRLYANYKDVKLKMDEAYWAAVLKVVVKPVQLNSSYYQISNQYFQQQLDEYVTSYRANEFVILYTQQEATAQQISPDQIISLQFDDFVVGQTYVKERVERLKRDSVLIGETREKKKIYGTVKATLNIYEQRVSSSGLLSFTIVDWQSNKILKQQQVSGSYIWQDSWASYKGDERALTNQQLRLTTKRQAVVPVPAMLFLEFTKPIYSQLVNELNYFYNKY